MPNDKIAEPNKQLSGGGNTAPPKQNDLNSNLNTRLEHVEQKLDEVVSGGSPLHYPGSDFQYANRDNEIDLSELWTLIWKSKWIVVVTTFVFAIVAVVYALSLPNIYKSEALLASVEDNSGGGLGRLAGQFGGLASLAGVNLGGGGSDKTTLAIEVLQSRKFITKFIQTHDLLVPLMAAKGWDRSRDELIINSNTYDVGSRKWLRDPAPPRKAEPSLQEAYEKFVELFVVSQDKNTSFVSISVEFYSPFFAKLWVDWLVEDINEEIKVRDVADAKKSIRYLTGQLEKTSIADMQAIFYELIEEQSKTVMFAAVRDEYVFKTIDEAISPELKVKPKRALICILGVFLGGALGLAIVFVRHFVRS